MKYFSSITLFCFLSSQCFCQVLTNNGSVVNISSGTYVNAGSFENLNGTLSNSGTFILKYSYHNLAIITGNGNYDIGGNWLNNGTFNAGTGKVTLNGTTAQDIYSTNGLNNLTINKTAGSAILTSDITVNGVLNFIAGNIQTGSNKVIISSTGNITGTSQSTGWLNGNLQKNIQTGPTTQTYEVGDNVYYSPASITLNGVTTGGSLTMVALATDHPNLNTSTIDATKSVNRYFKLTNNGIVFTDASVTLNWVASDIDAGASTANFKAGRYNGSVWSYPTIASLNPTSIQVAGLTTFGEFAIGESLMALPVKLLNLTGYIKNQGIQLEWKTQSEINMERYDVERSSNGQQFVKTGTVQTKGNSNVVLSYAWFDASPFNNINYYRIKSVEKSGVVSYSEVIKVNIISGRSEIVFYPNLVISNTINLQLKNIPQGAYSLSLINTLGQQVFKKLILHDGSTSMQAVPVNNVPAGMYFLNLSGNGIKFTKQVQIK